MAVRSGLVSVTADEAPLAAVLRAVGDAAGFEVRAASVTDPFSGHLADLPLPEALHLLLRARSYSLHYDETGDPVLLVVMAPGQTRPPPVAAPIAQPPEAASPSAQDELWITRRLASPDVGTRIVAVRRLDRLPAARAAAIGQRILTTDPEPVVRAQLAATLGRVDGDAVVDPLTALLADRDPLVRTAAARALGGHPDEAAAHALGKVLLSADEALRQTALQALASHPAPAADNYLRDLASRPGDPMAEVARQALAAPVPAPAADEAIPCLHAAGAPACLTK